MPPSFPAEAWATALPYPAYQALSLRLLADDQTTNGQNTPQILALTRPALARMQDLYEHAALHPDLAQAAAQLPQPQRWLVLTESWCGDAAENLPILAKLADHAPHLELRVLLRDQHPALMDAYLTNGGRSIPKLIAWAATGQELGTWGPRPAPAQQFVTAYKQQHPDAPLADFVRAVNDWYRTDATASLQAELLPLLRAWGAA